MKKIFLTILLMIVAIPCFASNVLIYDVDTGAIKSYLRSVNTPDYENRTDVLINPDISLIDSVERKYIKVDGGVLVEMTQEEKDVILAAEAQTVIDAQNASDNNLDVTLKEAFIAWLAVYNSKVPAQYQVTGAELIQKIKDNR